MPLFPTMNSRTIFFSRSFLARKMKYLEFISGNKVALFSRLINCLILSHKLSVIYWAIYILLGHKKLDFHPPPAWENNYLLPGKKLKLFSPRQKLEVFYCSSEARTIIMREFVEVKKGTFYRLIRHYIFSSLLY